MDTGAETGTGDELGDEVGSEGSETDTSTTTTTTTTTSDTGTTSETDTSTTGPVCGDGIAEVDEACDDANADESDGCLSTCVIPRTCAEILAELPASPSGVYTLRPDGDPLAAYCDMASLGGGWTLIAKVHRAETNNLPEPPAWFTSPMNVDQLSSPMTVLDGPLASHGGQRFAAVLSAETLARFDVLAADDPNQRASFFKRVASAESLAGWFADDPVASQVCADVDMTANCAEGRIAVEADEPGLVYLGNMDLAHHGYETIAPLAMRLDDNVSAAPSGICSCTLDNQDNAWADDYEIHWGNGLLIWLR